MMVPFLLAFVVSFVWRLLCFKQELIEEKHANKRAPASLEGK